MWAQQCLRGTLVTGMWLVLVLVLLLHLVPVVSKIPYFSRDEFQLDDDFEWIVFVQHRMMMKSTMTHSADSYDDHCMEQHDALNANVIFH